MKQPRWWFYLPIVVVAVGSLVFATLQAEVALLHDGATAAAAPPWAAAARQDTQQQYDYFPDHYANQAKEASQPVDQF